MIRGLLEHVDRVLLGKRCLILDRDPVFTTRVHQRLGNTGEECYAPRVRRWAWAILLVLTACASGGSPSNASEPTTLGGNDTSSEADGGSSSSSTTTTTTASSSSDTAVADSSTGPLGPGCGNAVIESGEECDDGNDDPCDGCDACLRRTLLVFDGGDGHFAQVGDVAGAPLALVDTPLTVEAWMRLDGPDDRVELMRRGAGNTGWRMGILPGSVVATVFSGFDHIVPDAAAPGTGWHHLAWTYDQQTSRLYLDGAELPSMAGVDPVLQTDAPVRMGAQVSGTGEVTGFSSGRIDEVRISTAVRYIGPFEPVRRHEPDGATVLLLHLDEGEGTDLFDASMHLHPGTATGIGWEPDDGYACP